MAMTELGFLLLMSSTHMNAVDTRPCGVMRENTVANRHMSLRRWPQAALEKHPALTDLRCI